MDYLIHHQNVTFNVPDISCEHYERTINNTLQSVDGVRIVRVDILARRVQVEFDDKSHFR